MSVSPFVPWPNTQGSRETPVTGRILCYIPTKWWNEVLEYLDRIKKGEPDNRNGERDSRAGRVATSWPVGPVSDITCQPTIQMLPLYVEKARWTHLLLLLASLVYFHMSVHTKWCGFFCYISTKATNVQVDVHKKQIKCQINDVTHHFCSTLIKGPATLYCELGVVQVSNLKLWLKTTFLVT